MCFFFLFLFVFLLGFFWSPSMSRVIHWAKKILFLYIIKPWLLFIEKIHTLSWVQTATIQLFQNTDLLILHDDSEKSLEKDNIDEDGLICARFFFFLLRITWLLKTLRYVKMDDEDPLVCMAIKETLVK